jgi:hypothetical protein
MSPEFNVTHTVFMSIAAALLVSAAVNYRAMGISGFIVVGFVIYCMSAAMSGFRQGEQEAAQKLKQARRRKRKELP